MRRGARWANSQEASGLLKGETADLVWAWTDMASRHEFRKRHFGAKDAHQRGEIPDSGCGRKVQTDRR